MDTILVYQCQSCMMAWEKKEAFQKHGEKNGHLKCAVIKLPTKTWNDLKVKHFSEDEE